MTATLMKRDPSSIQVGTPAVPVGTEIYFTPDQEQMILKTFLGGASKDEAVVLLETVRRRRLDPFSRQVYFVKRWDSAKREEVWAIQTSIDGLRSIADRTGRYEGQTAPQWCGQDGAWRDVWLASEPPAAARVGVYKTAFREPVYGIARFDAYKQTKKDGSLTQFWARMSDVMLAKCAEALALRKAFPEDTGGLYISEEMQQEKDEPKALDVTPPAAPLPPRTVEAPKPEPVKQSSSLNLPPHVSALWKRCVETFGKAEAWKKWEAAATTLWGADGPKPGAWDESDTRAVSLILFPDKSIPF